MSEPSKSILPKDSRKGAPRSAGSPPLTSLVDMMTILVVFLLVNLSVQGDLASRASDMQLPTSSSPSRLAPALSVEVTLRQISVEGVPVLPVAEAVAADSLVLPTLLAALEGAGDTQGVTLQCDRDLDFAVIKRVLRTCAAAGIRDFALLAEQETP